MLPAYYYLIIVFPSGTTLHTVHGQIGISFVTRFRKLCQFSAFGFTQLAFLHASGNESATTIMQKCAFIARAFCCTTYSSAFDHFLDQKPFFVDVHMRFVRSTKKIVTVAHDLLVGPN